MLPPSSRRSTMSATRPSPSFARRPLMWLLMGAVAFAALAGPAAASEPSPGPDSPVCMPIDPSVGPSPCADGATDIDPDPTVIDPWPVAWDHIVVGADGRTLTVYFWMGVEDCNGLHSVEVSATATGVDVTVLAGTPVGAEARVCIALAQ